MSNILSTNDDDQPSQPYDDAVLETATLVDCTMAEWFCRTLAEATAAAMQASGIEDGVHVLSSFGEQPVAADPRTWKRVTPANRAFAIGDYQAMAMQAVAWAIEPGRNVYLPMTVFPSSLAGNKRGAAAQALGVFGLGADLDRDKGRNLRIEDLPLPPTCVISSSRDPAENFNVLWLFNRLIPIEEARSLARALADVVGDSDGGTADPTHVWRVPGTLNWPKKAKVARGRPLEPQPVRLVCCGVAQ